MYFISSLLAENMQFYNYTTVIYSLNKLQETGYYEIYIKFIVSEKIF